MLLVLVVHVVIDWKEGSSVSLLVLADDRYIVRTAHFGYI